MSEPINDLGVIVNDREGEEKTFNLDEAVLPLRFPNNIFDRLVKAASFYNFPNVESYCQARLVESLNTKIGAAHINAPTAVSGVEAKKITGPMGGIVSRYD